MQLKKPPIYDKLLTSTFCLHRERYPIDQTYQREEGTWETSDEQYLIDTILRGFAMPPIFLHEKGDKEFIVDGQQRKTSNSSKIEFKGEKMNSLGQIIDTLRIH